MRSQIESGAELLARLNSKPSLHGLDDTLFDEGGPWSTDIVEINGERSAGKTLLLSQLLAKCILPNTCGTIRINGCDAPAILINTDHHFQVSKLIELMISIVDAAYAAATPTFASKTIDDGDYSNKTAVAQDSLRNLRVIDCYDSEQFLLTLHTLDDILISNTDIALLAIDSITAFYWQDRGNDGISTTIDSYVNKLLKHIRTYTTQFNVATIYTRTREISVNRGSPSFESIVDRRVHLHRTHDSQGSACTFENRRRLVKQLGYSISSTGIKWRT